MVSVTPFAALSNGIRDVVKEEGHQFDSFSLEVSLALTVVENKQAVRLYITKKYSSESWFTEKFPSGVKSDESSFRIHLIYTRSDASDKNQSIHESNGC